MIRALPTTKHVKPVDSLSTSIATDDAVDLLPRLSEVLRHLRVVLKGSLSSAMQLSSKLGILLVSL